MASQYTQNLFEMTLYQQQQQSETIIYLVMNFLRGQTT